MFNGRGTLSPTATAADTRLVGAQPAARGATTSWKTPQNELCTLKQAKVMSFHVTTGSVENINWRKDEERLALTGRKWEIFYYLFSQAGPVGTFCELVSKRQIVG